MAVFRRFDDQTNFRPNPNYPLMNPNRLLTGAFAAVSLLTASFASAQNGTMVDTRYTGHYFFGDSLTDNGNLYVVTGGTQPPSPPYNQRFTNALVFAEYLVPGLQRATTAPLGVNQLDFAFGGATAAPAANPPGFAQQIGLFNSRGITIGANELVSVFFGANDFFNAVNIPANQNAAAINALAAASVSNVVGGVQTLLTRGGRNFIVFYLPDLGSTPAFRTSPANPLATLYTTSFNSGLQTALTTALATAPAGTNITIVNARAFLDRLIATPATFGLTNTTIGFLQAGTGNVAQYLFFDSVHPTSTVQQLEAMFVNEILNPQWALGSAAALSRSSLATVNLVADNTISRLDTIRANDIRQPMAYSSVVSDPKSGAKSTVAAPSERKAHFDLYAGYNYQDGNRLGDRGSYATDFNINMVTVGGDFTLRCGFTAGLSANFAQTAGTIANGGNYRMDSNIVNAYVMWRRPGSFFIDGSFGGGSVDITKINRPTNVPGIIANGSTSGSVIDGHVRVGYEFRAGPGFVFGPVIGYRYLQSQLNAYSESNGAGLDFHYDRQTFTSNIGTFGLFGNYQGKLGRMDMSLRLSGVYLYNFSNDNRNVSGRLANNISNNTVLSTYQGNGDVVNLGIGATAMITRRIGLNLDYVGGIPKDGAYSNRFGANLSFKF